MIEFMKIAYVLDCLNVLRSVYIPPIDELCMALLREVHAITFQLAIYSLIDTFFYLCISEFCTMLLVI